MTGAELAPFQRLVKLIERELELAERGRLEQLQAAVERTGAQLASLPQPAPQSALPLVLRAQAMRNRVTILLERLQDELGASRSALRRGRRIARVYRPKQHERISTSV